MEKERLLYYATNRKHIGPNPWKPASYDIEPSEDGYENLRFGEVCVKYNPDDADDYLNGLKHKRRGDGVGLSNYLTEQSEDHSVITAYQDRSFDYDQPIDEEELPSRHFFEALKRHMEGGNNVLIYIHGFNVSWDEAVGGALALEMMLNNNPSDTEKESTMVVLFSWPSNGRLIRNSAYKSDRVDGRDSGKAVGRAILKLNDFLASIGSEGREPCGQKMSILCHSMGNFVLESAVRSKILGYTQGRALPRIFDQIFLCAADVNDDALEQDQGLGRLHELTRNITVYYNDGDMGMHIGKYTKTMRERLGHTGSARPSQVHRKVHQVDCTPIVRGPVEHSYYLWATVNRDIRMSLNGWRQDDSRRRRSRDGSSNEWVIH